MPQKTSFTKKKRQRSTLNSKTQILTSKKSSLSPKIPKPKNFNSQPLLGPWSLKDDQLLISLVESNGPSHWNYISSFFPGRIGKQCRERWCNHLSPAIIKSPWSNEEEIILFLLHRKYGNKWSLISNDLKGRTDNTIKNHWNSTMKKKVGLINEKVTELILKLKEEKEKFDNEDICELESELVGKLKKQIQIKMKKVNEEKKKLYEKFKKLKFDTNAGYCNNIKSKNIRKVLGFRTHSKKSRKKGRRRNNISNENLNEIQSKFEVNTFNDIPQTETTVTLKDANASVNTSHFSAFKNYSESFSDTPISNTTPFLKLSSYMNIMSLSTPLFCPIQKPIQIICDNSTQPEIVHPRKNLAPDFILTLTEKAQ